MVTLIKQNTIKILKRMSFTVVLALVLANSTLTAAAFASTKSSIKAYGMDTFAGNSTILKTTQIAPDQSINFVVTKPDGLMLTLPAKTDLNGVAQLELYDYHTQKAGKYQVSAYLKSSNFSGTSLNNSSFTVFAGQVDANKSVIEVNKTMLQNTGSDLAKVTVKLVDKFDNPVAGHSLKVVSSRNNDQVSYLNKVTNVAGELSFTVASKEKGLSSLTIIDSTADVILNQRLNLVFVEGVLPADVGGDLIPKALAQSSAGSLNGFELSGFPSSINVNQDISFNVKAVDNNNLTVQNYTGTIVFSAEGANSSAVTLPENYKFLAEDLGQHQFGLGLRFSAAGTYKIMVNDLNDRAKKGEITLTVGESGGGLSGGSNSTNASTVALINSPAAGTYSQSVQTVSGNVGGPSLVQVYDNDVLIGSIPASVTGTFSFTTPMLAEGNHEIYVTAVDQVSNEIKATSNKVAIKIDTTAPKIDQIDLNPKTGITAGSVIDVGVYSEANLSQAAVVFNFDVVELNPSLEDPSYYVGQIQAPAEAGVYPMDFILVDELGNEITLRSAAELTVNESGESVVEVDDQNIDSGNENNGNNNGSENIAGRPSQVSGLIAYGSDKKVTLVWDAATDDVLVQNYKIFYGDSIMDLTNTILTNDASTTWYIPGLENGKEYFFAVKAVDNQGNESENRSEVVSGIPFVLEINNALNENRPTESIDEGSLRPAAYEGEMPNRTTSTGPGLLILLAGSAASGLVLTRKKK